jgi:WD40 repeat protein
MNVRDRAPLVGVTGIAFASSASPERVLVCRGDCVQAVRQDGSVDWTTLLEPRGTTLHGVRPCCDDCGALLCHGSRFLSLLENDGSVTVPAIDLGDWILTARFAAGCREVLAVLAQSALVVVSATDGAIVRRVALSAGLWSCALITSVSHPVAVAGGTLGGAVARWSEGSAARFERVGSAVHALDEREGQLVSGCDDRSVLVLGEGRQFGHGDRVWSVAWSAAGEVVSGGGDGTLRWWRIGEAQFGETVFVGRSAVRRIAVCGRWIACGCDDGSVSLWRKPDPPSTRPVLTLPPGAKARFLSVDPASGCVFSVVGSRLYREGVLLLEHAGGAALVYVGHASNDRLIVAARDGLLMLLSGENGNVVYREKVCKSAVSCALADDAVLVASFDSFAVVDLESGKLVWAADVLPLGPKETITACALLGSSMAVVGTSRGSIGVARRGADVLWKRAAHADAVTDVRLVLAGTQLWSLCRDGRVGLWDAATMDALSLARPRCVDSCDCAESWAGGEAGGAVVARLHSRGAAQLCELPPDEAGTVVGCIPGLLPRSLCAAAVSGSRLVAAALLPGSAEITRFEWPFPARHVLRLLPPSHATLVNAVAVSRDGLVATADDSGRWALWDGQALREALFFRKSGSGSVRVASWWRQGELLLASATRLSRWRGQVCAAQLKLPLAPAAPRVMWLVLVKDGAACLLGDSAGTVQLVDLERWSLGGRLSVASSCLSAATLSGSGFVALVTTRGEVMHVDCCDPPVVIRRCRVSVSSLSAVAACGSAFDVCAGDDGAVGWAVLPDGRHQSVALGHAAAVVALLAPAPDTLCSLSNDQTVRVFRVDPAAVTLTVLRVLPTCVAHPACFAVLSERLIVAGTGIDLVDWQ